MSTKAQKIGKRIFKMWISYRKTEYLDYPYGNHFDKRDSLQFVLRIPEIDSNIRQKNFIYFSQIKIHKNRSFSSLLKSLPTQS